MSSTQKTRADNSGLTSHACGFAHAHVKSFGTNGITRENLYADCFSCFIPEFVTASRRFVRPIRGVPSCILNVRAFVNTTFSLDH